MPGPLGANSGLSRRELELHGPAAAACRCPPLPARGRSFFVFFFRDDGRGSGQKPLPARGLSFFVFFFRDDGHGSGQKPLPAAA
jgi:hypothetical protein